MSLIKCTKCGELYADTYRGCPFCAEDEAYYRGSLKKGSRRLMSEPKKKKGIFVPLLCLMLVIVVGGVIWLLSDEQNFLSEDDVRPFPTYVSANEENEQDASSLVVLSMESTLRLAPNEDATLSVSGGTDYEWRSSDPTVAVVNNGIVTAVSEGTALITVTDSSNQSAVCYVTVATDSGETAPTQEQTPAEPIKPTKPSDTPKTPEKTTPEKTDINDLVFTVPLYGTTLHPRSDGIYDVTINKSGGENSLTIVIDGTSGGIVWSSKNESRITVSDGMTNDGKPKVVFKAVDTGETTVTALLGEKSFSFRVLVR